MSMSRPLKPATTLVWLRGVGDRRARDLKRQGIETVKDLLDYLPFRFEDRSRFASIASLRPGAPVSVQGKILSCRLIRTRRPGFTIIEAMLDARDRPEMAN